MRMWKQGFIDKYKDDPFGLCEYRLKDLSLKQLLKICVVDKELYQGYSNIKKSHELAQFMIECWRGEGLPKGKALKLEYDSDMPGYVITIVKLVDHITFLPYDFIDDGSLEDDDLEEI